MSRRVKRKKGREDYDLFRWMGAIPYTHTHDGEKVLKKYHYFDNIIAYREVLRDYVVKGGYVLNWIKKIRAIK